MPNSNSIKKILGIKDPHITIEDVKEEKIHQTFCTIICGTLDKPFHRCPTCGTEAKYQPFIKNGRKTSRILLNKAGNQVTYLCLKKQRYRCRACQS